MGVNWCLWCEINGSLIIPMGIDIDIDTLFQVGIISDDIVNNQQTMKVKQVMASIETRHFLRC